MTDHLPQPIRDALARDLTIDIITIGRKSGLPRTTEIWFSRVDDRIIICGTPSSDGDGKGPRKRRDWLANLKANPAFVFRLKESLVAEIPARAVEVTDPDDRRYIMSAPSTRWYREQVPSIDKLVDYSPIVEVFFD